MVCPYCEEIVTAQEIAAGMSAEINGGHERMHRECLVRSVAGSVTHIRRECRAYGGVKDCHECEDGLTPRQAARAAWLEIKVGTNSRN